MTWLNLSKSLRREIEAKVKRGLRPDEIRSARERAERERMEAKRAAAELDLTPRRANPYAVDAIIIAAAISMLGN